MRYILLILLFTACNPYKQIVKDPFRNSGERGLLARAYQSEFPAHDSISTSITVDSTDYLGYIRWLENYIDSIQRNHNPQYPAENMPYFTFPLDNMPNDNMPLYPTPDPKPIIKFTTPPPIIQTVIKETVKWDEGKLLQLRNENAVARDENDKLTKEKADAEQKVKTAKKNFRYALFTAIGLFAVLIAAIVLRIKKVF